MVTPEKYLFHYLNIAIEALLMFSFEAGVVSGIFSFPQNHFRRERTTGVSEFLATDAVKALPFASQSAKLK